jgi:hypothetical protein
LVLERRVLVGFVLHAVAGHVAGHSPMRYWNPSEAIGPVMLTDSYDE